MAFNLGDVRSTLYAGLSGFWQRFFRDTQDIEAFYQASEMYLGQVYLDLLNSVLSSGLVDTPILSKEYWKLLTVRETDLLFVEGDTVEEDRYNFELSAPQKSIDFLQNTIVQPDKTYEQGLDFFGAEGVVAFTLDLFREYYDEDNEVYTPSKKVGWRYVDVAVGNALRDDNMLNDWQEDHDAKRGDQLAILGYRGRQLYPTTSPVATSGYLDVQGIGVASFKDMAGTPVDFEAIGAKKGDIIEVIADTPENNGQYIIGEDPSAGNEVFLRDTINLPEPSTSSSLKWRLYKGVYSSDLERVTVGYYNGNQLVAHQDTPLLLTNDAPVIYAVLRRRGPEAKAYGVTVSSLEVTELPNQYIVPGTLKIYCTKYSDPTTLVEEGVDYTVDYRRGLIKRLTADWGAQSLRTCDYEFFRLIGFSAGAQFEEVDVARVKQVALWAPEVWVDRKLLADVYGSLLARERPSTAEYKTFLRGILSLYVHGPILQRIESAMNVAAGYPVVRSFGEVLQGYSSGVDAEGVAGEIDGSVDTFSTTEYTFVDADVGGVLEISEVANDKNRGTFTVEELVDANTVKIRSSFGFETESGITWRLSRTGEQVVTTSARSYYFPLEVPVKKELKDITNYGVMSFDAFDVLTEAFYVVDYMEDPYWWINKTIPKELFKTIFPSGVTEEEAAGLNRSRSIASSKLYEHVLEPVDDARIGDPGLFIGADSFGNEVDNPIRQGVAFHIFDSFLKYHTFYVEIAAEVGLSVEFRRDLEELILATRPAHTYPIVEPNSALRDILGLYEEELDITPKIQAGDAEQIATGGEVLSIGDPVYLGTYYRYVQLADEPSGHTGYVYNGDTIALPFGPGVRPYAIRINATVGGTPVVEGTDYWIDWREDSPDAWTLYALTDWDFVASVTFDAHAVETVNIDTTPTPDTTVGFTPIIIGGVNPFYVREGSLAPNIPAEEWAVVRTNMISRALSLHVDAGGGTPYTYP